jgi:ABC-type nitrate/sulfonate/bicarbonate transport system substrate-binding protein
MVGFAHPTVQAEGRPNKVVAGGPGNDQIQPYVDQHLGIWQKYNLNVDFEGANWMRAAQRMASGDFDAGYISFASAIRYRAAGMDVVITGTSSANCTTLVSNPEINSVADLKGKKVGIVAKFDVDYMAFTRMVLPRYGLSASDLELVSVPSTDIAGAVLTGGLAAAYTFERTARMQCSKARSAYSLVRNGLTNRG